MISPALPLSLYLLAYLSWGAWKHFLKSKGIASPHRASSEGGALNRPSCAAVSVKPIHASHCSRVGKLGYLHNPFTERGGV